MNQERDDLENLLKSAGWHRLVTWAEEEWTAQLTGHLRSAANDTNDLLALQKIRQVIAAKEAVQRFLERPKERLAQLALKETVAQPAELTYSRRGTL